jgi:hypothetical protein
MLQTKYILSAYTDRYLVTTIIADNGLESYPIKSCFVLTVCIESRLHSRNRQTVVHKRDSRCCSNKTCFFNGAFTTSDFVATNGTMMNRK